MATALTVYFNSFAASSTLSTANPLVTALGGTNGVSHTTKIGTTTGWIEIQSQGSTATPVGLGSMGGPSGNGWFLDATTLDGQTIAAGNWTPSWKLKLSIGTATATLVTNAYIYNPSTTSYTLIGSVTLSAQALTTTSTNYVFTAGSLPAADFPAGTKLYIDTWINITVANANTGATLGIGESTVSGAGTSVAQVVTPGFSPTPVALAVTLPGSGTFAGTLSANTALTVTQAGTGTLAGNLTTSSDITRIQGNAVNSAAGVTSQAITLPTGITLGNLVVVNIATGNNATTFTPPDGSWQQATFNQPAGASATISAAIYYLVVDAGHAGQTSWTWTLSASHTAYITIEEWHSVNGWSSNPLDQTANGDTVGTPVAATTIDSGTTATTTQARELWIAALAYKGSAQTESSITSGWTKDLEATLAANNTMTMLYQVASATGTADCSYVIGTAEFWAGCVATFKDGIGVSLLGEFDGVGTLAGTAATSTSLTVTLPGVGTLSGSSSNSTMLSSTFAGVGTLAATAQRSTALADTLSGVGTLSGTSALSTALAGTEAGAGTLSGAFSLRTALSGSLAGVGTLAGTPTDTTALSTTLPGVGALSGSLATTGPVSLVGTLAGSGVLSATVALSTALTDVLAGVGTFAAAASTFTTALAVSLPGVGAVTGALTAKTALTATVVGVGTVAGAATLSTALAVTFPGVGLLNGSPQAVLSVTLAGVGSLAGTTNLTVALSTTLPGTAALTGPLSANYALTASLAGSSSLTGSASLSTALSVSLAGAGVLTETVSLSTALSGTFAGIGTLSGSNSPQSVLSVTLAGVGSLAGTPSLATALSVTIPGVASLVGTVSARTVLTASLAGSGSLVGSVSLSAALSTSLSGVGSLVGVLTYSTALTGTLIGQGTFSGAITEKTALATVLVGQSTFAGTPALRVSLTATTVGIGTLSGTLQLRVVLLVTLSGAGTLSGAFTIIIGSGSPAIRSITHTTAQYLNLVEQVKPLLVLTDSIRSALSVAWKALSSLSLSSVQLQSLTIVHQGIAMPTPNSTILSTITVTDINGAAVSNAGTVSVVVHFPGGTTTTYSLGSGVTNVGNGQYTAKYNTGSPGTIREIWSVVAADGTTIASEQFEVGVGY